MVLDPSPPPLVRCPPQKENYTYLQQENYISTKRELHSQQCPKSQPMSTLRRISSAKRALCIHKTTAPYFRQKSPTFTTVPQDSADEHFAPHPLPKEPHIITKRAPHIHQKSPTYSHHEPYLSTKEPYLHTIAP